MKEGLRRAWSDDLHPSPYLPQVHVPFQQVGDSLSPSTNTQLTSLLSGLNSDPRPGPPPLSRALPSQRPFSPVSSPPCSPHPCWDPCSLLLLVGPPYLGVPSAASYTQGHPRVKLPLDEAGMLDWRLGGRPELVTLSYISTLGRRLSWWRTLV